MFVWFGPEGIKSVGTEEVSPGIMLDFDSGRPGDRHRSARCERAHGAAESCRLSRAAPKVKEGRLRPGPRGDGMLFQG